MGYPSSPTLTRDYSESPTLIRELEMFQYPDEYRSRIAAGDMNVMRLAANMLSYERRLPNLSNRELAQLWKPLRESVPLLVARAKDGDLDALRLLHGIHGNFDPYINVPWRELPRLSKKDHVGPPDGGVAGYAFVLRLRRCLGKPRTVLA